MRAAAFAVVLFASASGCSLLHEAATRPAPEPPVRREEGVLSRGNPDELGPDERLLLAEYTDTQAAKVAMEAQLAEARATIDGLQAQIRQLEEARDRERTGRAAAEAEAERLRATLQDREAKILSLHLEKAKVTQDLLLARIEAAERQAEAAEEAAKAAGPAMPPRGGER